MRYSVAPWMLAPSSWSLTPNVELPLMYYRVNQIKLLPRPRHAVLVPVKALHRVRAEVTSECGLDLLHPYWHAAKIFDSAVPRKHTNANGQLRRRPHAELHGRTSTDDDADPPPPRTACAGQIVCLGSV